MPPVEFQDSWNGQMGASLVWGLNHKINMCQANLRNWNRTSFGHVRNLLSQKLRELKLAEELDGYRTNPTCIYQLQEDIEMLKSKEECMWKQRSRNTWLKEGDHNTRNYILGLNNETGVWVEEEDQLGNLVEKYFQDMSPLQIHWL